MANRNEHRHPLELTKLVADIRVYADPELKRLAGEEADKQGLPLSEFVAKTLAERLGRPELGRIPRKKVGRPRNQVAAR
jgi:hypothetical protein